MGNNKPRDDKLRGDVGIYENTMDDFAALADIFIGNETADDFTSGGDYEPLLLLISELHFNPENDRLFKLVTNRIKLLEKKLLKLRTQIDGNHKKAKFIYRNR